MTPSTSVKNFLHSLKQMVPSTSSTSSSSSSSSSTEKKMTNNLNLILIFREIEERNAMKEAVEEIANSLGLDVSLSCFACPWKAMIYTGVMSYYCCTEHENMEPIQVDAVLADDWNFCTFSLLIETYDHRSWMLRTEAHHFTSREAKSLVERMEVAPNTLRSLQSMFYKRLYKDSAAQKESLMERLRYILDPTRERIGHWKMLRTDPTREGLRKQYTQEDLLQVNQKRIRWIREKLEGLEIIHGGDGLGGQGVVPLPEDDDGGDEDAGGQGVVPLPEDEDGRDEDAGGPGDEDSLKLFEQMYGSEDDSDGQA